MGASPWSNGSVLDHRSVPPVFECRRGLIWRVFHLWLRFITFGGRSAHFAYHVHKSGHNTPIMIIIIYPKMNILKWSFSDILYNRVRCDMVVLVYIMWTNVWLSTDFRMWPMTSGCHQPISFCLHWNSHRERNHQKKCQQKVAMDLRS